MNPPKYATPFTFEELNAVLRYDPLSGHIHWRERWHPQQKEDLRADGRLHKGRPSVDYRGTKMMAHRVAWLLQTGEWPMFQVDHEDRDAMNNRWGNLRQATHRDNHLNAGPRFGKRFKGTQPYLDRWRAQIELGRFDTEEEAARAYDAAVIKVFNKFAYTNFPRQTRADRIALIRASVLPRRKIWSAKI